MLTGCSATSSLDFLADGRQRADILANRHGWHKQWIDADGFRLLSYSDFRGRSGGTLAVYIEGDGLSWLSRTQQSPDPTPVRPDVLAMAVQDPTPDRLYLGRPCQYLTSAELAACSPDYWSVKRLAPEVVAALNTAIDREKAAAGARTVSLFGWSGGGAAAALVAARRSDVVRLVTASADLDTAAWTRLKQVTPLHGSLNPADVAPRLGALPQVHFVGLDDDRVPPSVTASFLARLPAGTPVREVRLPGYDHDCCWIDDWAALLRRYVYR